MRKDQTNAFEVMRKAAKVCWTPTSISTLSIIQLVAENGFFPWQGGRKAREDIGNSNSRLRNVSRCLKDALDEDLEQEGCQNEDFSNLRLVSKEMKEMMDDPKFGGPYFDALAHFLDQKNCLYKRNGMHPALQELDPRLNNADFYSLPARERAKLLLQFLRNITVNFVSVILLTHEFDPNASYSTLPLNIFSVIYCSIFSTTRDGRLLAEWV